MKGIILAGGLGTRLHPITKGLSKQLLPVYDKPMIYYPISVLMYAEITEILIISTPNDLPSYEKLLGDGSEIGVKFSYAEQPKPEGLAQAFLIGEEFIADDDVCLILGDNIFHGSGLQELLLQARKKVEKENSANVFGYYVQDPERYGVAEIDDSNNVISIEEKPSNPKSNYAIVGIYFYPNNVISKAKSLNPSPRGELEITSLNSLYLKEESLKFSLMGRGYAWLDTGTHESLSDAGEFIRVLENRQGLKVGCLEEVAMEKKFISPDQALELGNKLNETGYGQYIIRRVGEFGLETSNEDN